MTDKTKSQTYNFLLENKSIEDILNQPNTTLKEKRRHGGITYKLIEINNTNNQLVDIKINDELSENNTENSEIVVTSSTNNVKEQEINNDVWTKFKNYLNLLTTNSLSNTEELIQSQKKYIEQLEQSRLEKDKEIQQLKKQIEQSKQSDVNLKKYTYNAITIYDEKQRKNTGIEKIHEEILPINNEIYFIITFVHTNLSITEKIIYFHNFNNGDIEIIKQKKQYENINKYKDDFSLIEPNSNHEKNIKVEPVSIKNFLNKQEESKLKITKSEWIIFISLSLLSITLLAIPVVVPALVPIISTILWEKTLVSIIGIGIAWIVNKGIWTIATEKTKKVESWMKQSFYSLIRKISFVNKRNLGKTKEELEIKNNIKKNIENLTSDKLETKIKTQYDILKRELDNRKDKIPNQLINNHITNHNSNSILKNSSLKQVNPNNFDSSIRNTVNQSNEVSTSSNHNWNKVKYLLTT